MGQLCKGESFAALDGDGRRYRIVHWIEFVDLTDGEPGHPRLEPSGFECLRLEDGRIVDVLDGGRLEIAESGQLLSRIADASWTAPMTPRTGDPEASGHLPARGFANPVDDVPERSDRTEGAAGDAGLMAAFGIRREGRFFLCRGYRYTQVRDAVAYARQAREKPKLAQEEPRWERSPGPRAATDAGVPGTQDMSLMALLRITLADGQYVFDGFRYDRLHDAAAYARLQQSAPAP